MDIKRLLEKSISYLKQGIVNTEYYVYNKELVYFKKLSIQKLNNEDEPLNDWFDCVILLDMRKILQFPIEAYLVISREVNKEGILEEEKILVNEFNTLLIGLLFEEVHFNIDKLTLTKCIKNIRENNDMNYKKQKLLNKINRLVKVNSLVDKNCIIGFKIDDITKLEISAYFFEEINYYVLPNAEISIIDMDNNEILKSISKQNKFINIHNEYQNLNEYLRLNKRENIIWDNKYERMVFYSAIKYIVEEYNFNSVVKISNERIKYILELKDLFSDKYQKSILKKANMNTIDIYIKRLEKNPVSKTLKEIIHECGDIDWIFEILKLAPKIITEEIPIDIYVQGISKCSELDKSNIKIALYCEELLVSNPIITEEVVRLLVGMYESNVYTENTLQILEYLRCTVRDNRIIDETLIKIRSDKELYDKDFLQKFLKVYGGSADKRSLDQVINKLINSEDIELNKEMYDIVYDFYIRNNDIKALEILCEAIVRNKGKLKEFKINDSDVFKLLDYYIHLNKYDNKFNLLNILNEFKDYDYLLDKGVEILENLELLDFNNIPKELIDIYFEVITVMKDENENIKEMYINMLIKKVSKSNYNDLEIMELIDVLNSCDININFSECLEIIKIIINYYVKLKEYSSATKYIQYYLDKMSSNDDGKLFREILVNYYTNLDFIEEILKVLDFSKIEKVDQLLNITFNQLVSNERYELLVEILRYYNNTCRYNESIFVLQRYIENVKYIDGIIYDVFIVPILENLSESKLKEIYNSLIIRDDLPIEIREKFYEFNKSEFNTSKIIEEFEAGFTYSSLAKNLSLNKYYNDNDMFESLVQKGENDEESVNIILRKIENVFKENKDFVEFIISDELELMNSKLALLKSYAINYNENIYTLENSKVIGEHLVNEKNEGETCDELLLEHIFTGEFSNAILFKDYIVHDIMIKYLNNNKVNYKCIDRQVITIQEDESVDYINKESMIEVLKSFNELIKLQILLMKNNKIMIEFLEESFVINKKCFIPKSFLNISNFEEEFISRNKVIFDNVKGTKNRNRNTIINEKNIVKIMVNYLKKRLELKDSIGSENKIKDKFINNTINDSIDSLEELLKIIEVFIENESKVFEEISYVKQVLMFNEISIEDKVKVITRAIRENDTNPKIKNKVIYFNDIPTDLVDDYFKYIIECFNNTSNITVEDYGYIYDKVTEIISEEKIMEKTIIDQLDRIETLYIDSLKKCKYKSKDVREDVSKLNTLIDKEYIISRL